MSKTSKEDAEKIAVDYVARIGCEPWLFYGSEYYEEDGRQIWRIFFYFSPDQLIGIPTSLVVQVDDLTRDASHIQPL